MKLKDLLPLIATFTTIDLWGTGQGRLCYAYDIEDQDLQSYLEREIDIIYACADDVLQINLKNI